MRLFDFLARNKESILSSWEDFARTIEPPALTMDKEALRDHAGQMLDTIIADMQSPQSQPQQDAKSWGRGVRPDTGPSYAEIHAGQRLYMGYTIDQLVSEYRALRASVLKLWLVSSEVVLETDPDDVMRFHEAIDQALAESVAHFSAVMAQRVDNERLRLEAFLEAAPVGIGMADESGKPILVNAQIKRMWGDVPLSGGIDPYVGWNAWWADGSPRHGQRLEPHEWAMVRALRGEPVPSDVVEIEAPGLPGVGKTVLVQAAPVREAGQRIVGSVVAQMDITAQVKAEAALHESEAKFRTIANAMPQMVWSALPSGAHDYFNQRWYDYTGVADTSTDGEGWSEVFHPDDQPHARKTWRHSLASGEPYEIEYRLRHCSGEFRWVLGRALPVRDDAANITRWMGTCTDIHDHKIAQEELKLANQRKDEFLAMLAHELRNPLAPISMAAELLKRAGANETLVRKAGNIIERQVLHMTGLVDDLLDVSRVARGLVELQNEELDLRQAVDAAVEQVQPLVNARGHTLSLQLSSTPVFVQGDKARLVQVAANLLNNAAKYTPAGGNIALVVEASGAQVVMQVTDNGSGIEASLLPTVFELFTQGKRTLERAQGGLGLGLALVKNIVVLHGGQVSARSAGPGQGSVFTVMLPRVMRPAQVVSEDGVPNSAATDRSHRLMVVDDNLDAAQLLADVLEQEGHQVTVAADAQSALAASASARIGVFILDIGLPDMDGHALARRLRAEPATAGALLIALTGYGQAQDRVLSKAAGFDHHFVKPVDLKELAGVLGQARANAEGH